MVSLITNESRVTWLIDGAGGPFSEIRNRGKGGGRGGEKENEKEEERGEKKEKRWAVKSQSS